MHELSLVSKISLYLMLCIMGLICLAVWIWQFRVLKGRAMKNPDGSFGKPQILNLTIQMPDGEKITVHGIKMIADDVRVKADKAGYTGTGKALYLAAN